MYINKLRDFKTYPFPIYTVNEFQYIYNSKDNYFVYQKPVAILYFTPLPYRLINITRQLMTFKNDVTYFKQ